MRTWAVVMFLAAFAAGRTWGVLISLPEALDSSSLTWSTGGNAAWFGQATTNYYGGDAAQSGDIENSQSSWMETTVTGPGRVSFWWKVSTENYFDYLRFYVDGVAIKTITGETSWSNVTSHVVGAGTHTLRWTYAKDVSLSSGSDCGWVDRVVWGKDITVTFDSRGGTAVAPAVVAVGFAYGALAVPSYAGKTFCGWWTLPNGTGSRVAPDNLVYTTADHTLYAFWVTSVALPEALDNLTLVWNLSGNAAWFGQTHTSHDGVDAVRSGIITNNQNCAMWVTVPGPGAVSFWWSVSSEAAYDYLRFYLDGVEQEKISGSTGWRQLMFLVGPGDHQFLWRYTKDVSVNSRYDCGWVDQVVWTAGAPIIAVFNAMGGTVNPDTKQVVYGSVYGALPLSERAGYAFAGWWTGAGGTGTRVTENSTVTMTVNHMLYAKWIVPPTFAAALDTEGLEWTTGGSKNWLTQVMFTQDGVDATQSGGITNSQNSWLETTVAGPGTVSFWWKVSSKNWYDYLRFFIDGDEQRRIEGDVDWHQLTFIIGAGPHTLRWEYKKTGTGADGADCGWLDQVLVEPYVCSPYGDASASTPGAYDGYFYLERSFGAWTVPALRGTLTVKVTDVTKGKLTAKAMLQNGPLSYSATAWTGTEADGTLRAKLTGRGGETLDLRVRQNRIWGTLSGGTVGENLILDGGRNRFADRADTEAQALLGSFKGYYTVALPVFEKRSLGAAQAAPQGLGYLAVTIGNKGSAKIAGVLADGTKVTRSSRLILFDGCGPEACVPLFAPLYFSKGWAGGLLWLDPDSRTITTDRDVWWFIRWENPGSGPNGFEMLLDACGGFYNSMPTLAAAYLFTAEVGEVPYFYAGGTADWALAPENVPAAAAGMRMTLAKGTKPVKEDDGTYTYGGVNPASATLNFTARTGLIKGRFSLYYDYALDGRSQHKTVGVPYAGVMTPVRDGAFNYLPAGMGHCLIPDNNPAVKAYRLKRSFPVWLETAP